MTPGSSAGSGGVPRVLFVCRGNTCRSMMAEHFARALYGDRVVVWSAGLSPQAICDTADALTTLETFAIDGSGHVPRSVGLVDFAGFDHVVAMNESVAQELRQYYPACPPSKIVEWQITDPWRKGSPRYRECAEEIRENLTGFFSGLGIAATDA